MTWTALTGVMITKTIAGSGFQNYTTFSIWDIYRTEWPLLMLLHPDRINDMVQSMLVEYPQLGRHTLPVWPLWANETWCMPGYHSADMIAAAWLDGFHGFDAETAYQDMRETAMQDRRGLDTYWEHGVIASAHVHHRSNTRLTTGAWRAWRRHWAMSRTPGCFIGAPPIITTCLTVPQAFSGHGWRTANGASHLIRLGMVNDQYSEADAWQYAFAIQQDVPGLIAICSAVTRDSSKNWTNCSRPTRPFTREFPI